MDIKEYLDFQAIIFDLDGVLVNSSAVVIRSWEKWAIENKIDTKNLFQYIHGRRANEVIPLVAPNMDANMEAKKLAKVEAEDTNGLIVYNGAIELIDSLPKNKWAIVTSGTSDIAINRLGFAKIKLPHVLVTADNVKHGKPAPEGYLLASAQLEVDAKDCLVIEDSPAGINAAIAAGMTVIAVATTHDQSCLSKANTIVSDISKLLVTLEKSNKICVSIRNP